MATAHPHSHSHSPTLVHEAKTKTTEEKIETKRTLISRENSIPNILISCVNAHNKQPYIENSNVKWRKKTTNRFGPFDLSLCCVLRRYLFWRKENSMHHFWWCFFEREKKTSTFSSRALFFFRFLHFFVFAMLIMIEYVWNAFCFRFFSHCSNTTINWYLFTYR